MILKFSLFSAAGVAFLSSSTTSAFIPSKISSRAVHQHTSLESSTGGDGGPSPEFLAKMGVSGDADVNQMRQQQQPPPGMSPVGPAGQMRPPQAAAPPPPQQQQFYDANGNPVSMPMVYDANGNLVPYNPQAPPAPQQTMQQPQAQQMQPPAANEAPSLEPNGREPTLPPNSKTRGNDPRPQGYNADAYAVSNTADVYFAQLKQDSRVRKRAWLSGDRESANQVFTDPSVKEIKDSWVDNPYTKEKNIQEARAEIEGAVRMQLGGDDDDQKYTSGVSYKQKLEQMKSKRGGGSAAPVQASTPQQTQPVVSTPPQPVQVAPPVPKVEQPPVPKMEQPPAAPVQQPPMQQPPAPVKPQTVTPPSMASPTRSEATTEEALPGALSEDEKRRELRTLQGLLLKQRGGPGFGAGRLREAETHRLESTLEKVVGILRSEDADFIAGTPAAAVDSPPPVAQAPKPVQPVQPAKPAQPMQPPAPVQPVAPAQPIQSQSAPAPVQSEIDPMTGSIACVEAVLKMYQDASPSERQTMMIPLREALMAAASGANKVIAEAELKAHKATMEAGPPETAPSLQQNAPMMGFPTTYAVTKPDPSETETAAAPASDDNLTKLNNAYDALTDAQGSGKLGLKNLSGYEAAALANKVESMRGVLLDELNA